VLASICVALRRENVEEVEWNAAAQTADVQYAGVSSL